MDIPDDQKSLMDLAAEKRAEDRVAPRTEQIVRLVERMREPDIVRPDEEASLRHLLQLHESEARQQVVEQISAGLTHYDLSDDPGYIRISMREADFQRFLHPLEDRAVGALPAPTPDPWPKTPGGYDWPQCMQPIGPCRLPNGHGGPHAVGASEQAAPPLDVERLALAMNGGQAHHSKDNPALGERTRRDWTDEWGKQLRHAGQVAAEYARLGSAPDEKPPGFRHAAWCNLNADHEGLCEGDQ